MLILIAIVSALIITVTERTKRHASVVLASDPSGWACVREAIGLVRSVLAVILTVALPVLVDAVPVLASEPVLRTRFGTVGLVGTVCAVNFAIAFPFLENAYFGISTREFVILALRGTTVLVGSIFTLVLHVAPHVSSDAFAVSTSNF